MAADLAGGLDHLPFDQDFFERLGDILAERRQPVQSTAPIVCRPDGTGGGRRNGCAGRFPNYALIL